MDIAVHEIRYRIIVEFRVRVSSSSSSSSSSFEFEFEFELSRSRYTAVGITRRMHGIVGLIYNS